MASKNSLHKEGSLRCLNFVCTLLNNPSDSSTKTDFLEIKNWGLMDFSGPSFCFFVFFLNFNGPKIMDFSGPKDNQHSKSSLNLSELGLIGSAV